MLPTDHIDMLASQRPEEAVHLFAHLVAQCLRLMNTPTNRSPGLLLHLCLDPDQMPMAFFPTLPQGR